MVDTWPEGAPTYDIPLPLYSLRPDSFERFSVDFLKYYYRDSSVVVNLFGGRGNKQDGIDIEVRGDSWVHTFQCKRERQFGPQKVHQAVSAHKYSSDLNVLMLSNVATSQARQAIVQYGKKWQLWDLEDISSKFRALPMVDRRALVDIYFLGQRRPLLGVPESGSFQTPEEFFKGFVEPDRYFNHGWVLVGRDDELDQLTANVLDDGLLVTMLLGAPGSGKTRLLRELVARVRRQRPDIAVRFVSPTEEVKVQHLEELGTGVNFLIVDDAHDRDDIIRLMRYVSEPDNRGRLLLSLRPYGCAKLEQQASLVAMDSPMVAKVTLKPWSKDDAQCLATQVLQASGGPVQVADAIAELTCLTPLMTVLAAQVIAKESRPLALIGNSETFQKHLLAKYEKIITGQIVTDQQDQSKLQAVLRMVALLQPVVLDGLGFLNVLRQVEGLEDEDIQRLLRLLREGGVLFMRGLRYRLAPDLLADSIIQRNFLGSNGSVTPKVEKVFDLVDGDYLKHLLVNLGRLDWRLRAGKTEGSMLLSSIAPKLQWHHDYLDNPHIQAVEAVAYYQPRLALNFAKRLIDQHHANVPGVCEMVRNAIYNLEFLEEGCALLWRAGKDDARELHRCPHHGIRILKELAEFVPNKPVECVERVVAFAVALLDRPTSLRGCYTPFTILEGALRTEMEEITSKKWSVTFTRYRLPLELAKTVRARVIDVIVNSLLQGDSPRKAFLAAGLLSMALDSPMNAGEELKVWNVAHAELLKRVYEILVIPAVHPVVLTKAAMSVSWHAFYNRESDCGFLAQSILALLDRDLPTRLIRFIADAWGIDTWHADDSHERKAHQADTVRFIDDLAIEFPEAENLFVFLEQWLNEINQVAGYGWGNSSIFINQLLQHRADLAKVILTRHADVQSPLRDFAGAALAVLIVDQNRHALIAELLEEDSAHVWTLVSAAYARQQADGFMDADMPIVRRIFQSSEPAVLSNATLIGRQIAKRNPVLAVELICLADMTINSHIAHEFFMCLAYSDTIPAEVITLEQWRSLLQSLSYIPELNDHSVLKFLKKAVAIVPADVIGMLKSRLQKGANHLVSRTRSADGRDDGLQLFSHPDGYRLLHEFLLWAVNAQVGQGRSMDMGACVSLLCGQFGPEMHDLLLKLLEGGGHLHVNVVASVLRSAHQELVMDATPFIRKVLDDAEQIGESAVDEIISALIDSAFFGVRSGVPGEPFKEDVALKEHAEGVLAKLHIHEPVYRLYKEILESAVENITRQERDKRAMEDEYI